MKIQQIRNATVKIEYAGNKFLVDPWLLKKGEFGIFRDTQFRPVRDEMEDISMPMTDLPMPKEKLLEDIDAYIITHFHPDHIDWIKTERWEMISKKTQLPLWKTGRMPKPYGMNGSGT